MISYPISTEAAARWFIAHFGYDLPAGELWLWVQGVQRADIGGWLAAGEAGMEGIVCDD